MRISDWSSDVCSSDLLSRNERRAGRKQPCRQFGHVLWFSEAVHQNEERFPKVHTGIAGPLNRRCVDYAWADRIDPDVSGGIFDCTGFGDADQSRLCRAIDSQIRHCMLTGVGCGIHDRSTALTQHYFQLILHAKPRSEEHTSELQSLMRISYAVFCLKKKNRTINTKQKSKSI